MRDHNYHSRMKNCQVWFVLTVDNEKSLCEKKESPFEIIDCFFSEPVRQSAESILARFSKWQSMQLRADDYRVYWFSNEYCWKNCFRLYRASDHLGLEISARKLEEHTRMLVAISLSQGWTKCPAACQKFLPQNFHWKILLNFLLVLDVSSEL